MKRLGWGLIIIEKLLGVPQEHTQHGVIQNHKDYKPEEEEERLDTPDTIGRVVMIVVVGIAVMAWIAFGIAASIFLFNHFQ